MFRRAEVWLVEHPAIAALVAALLATLSTVLATLNDAATKQDGAHRSSKGATAEAKRLRQILLTGHIRVVARIALATIPDVVKATAALAMPRKNIGPEALHASAESMAAAAEQHQDVLVQAGLPPDTIAQLRLVTAQYRKAVDERGQSVAQRRGATTAINVQLNRARRILDTISPIVQTALRNDPATLAEWRQLKRVTLKGVPSREEPAEGTTPPATPIDAQLAASQAPAAQQEAPEVQQEAPEVQRKAA